MVAASLVYERRIDRPPDAQARATIERLIEQHRSEAPIAFKHTWDKAGRNLRLRTSVGSWLVSFDKQRVSVTSELSFLGRIFDTQANRARMRKFFDQLVEELGM